VNPTWDSHVGSNELGSWAPMVGRSRCSIGFLDSPRWEGTVTVPGSCAGKELLLYWVLVVEGTVTVPGSCGGKELLLYRVLVVEGTVTVPGSCGGRNCYSTGFLLWEGTVTLPGSCGGKELLFFIDEHISDGIGL